jgi:epsilon-lactone hydrolase
MPSWQARVASAVIRTVVRRRDWGSERHLVRRARALFGAPAPYGWLHTWGVTRHVVRERGVCGEWLAPPDAGPGVVLYAHGGGYVSCSVASHRPVTAALARLTRDRVFSVEYRRAPEHRHPVALDDVVAAYRWLLASGVAAHDIAVAGDSAGGGLALSLLLRARDERLPPPACAVLLSPWTDFTADGASARANDGPCALFHRENIAQFASVYLGAAPPRAASPVFADLADLPPLLLQVGSTEVLLDDARRVHDAVQRSGGRSELAIFDDVPHGWHLLAGLVPEADAALRAAAAFIVRHQARDPRAARQHRL